ncbi:hypothetical protein B0H13DRAFT_2340667 [Mycena leptocephala]|nr:hypothetical protein B0H13DRAFT_2340667 [Mycena leptocephala]
MDSNGIIDGAWDPTWDAAEDIVNPSLSLNFPDTSMNRPLEDRIMRLYGTPYDAKGSWPAVLNGLDATTLLKLASRARANAIPVTIPAVQFPPIVQLDSLPIELCLEVASHLKLIDRISLGKTSRFWRNISSRALQSAVRDILSTFDLCHMDVQFMQCVTLCILAGPAVEYLMNGVPSELRLHSVTQFFLSSTSLRWRVWDTEYEDGPINGTNRTCILESASGKVVKLFQSTTDNPMGPLACFPYTPLVGCATHAGLWHGHPRATLDMLAMPNQPYIDVSDPASRRHSMNLVTWFTNLGYVLQAHCDSLHRCGIDSLCPNTIRSSSDSGCAFMPFATTPFNGRFGNLEHLFSWFFARRPCVAPLIQPDPKYHAWMLRWHGLVHGARSLLNTPPRVLLRTVRQLDVLKLLAPRFLHSSIRSKSQSIVDERWILLSRILPHLVLPWLESHFYQFTSHLTRRVRSVCVDIARGVHRLCLVCLASVSYLPETGSALKENFLWRWSIFGCQMPLHIRLSSMIFIAVITTCGHGYCYSCIRIWLEEQWECPDCRTIITYPPFRNYVVEAHITKVYGDWDTSAVDYSWFGLLFPVLASNDS